MTPTPKTGELHEKVTVLEVEFRNRADYYRKFADQIPQLWDAANLAREIGETWGQAADDVGRIIKTSPSDGPRNRDQPGSRT